MWRKIVLLCLSVTIAGGMASGYHSGHLQKSSCQSKTMDIESGPAWIKNKLAENEVFSAPEFRFTDEYDKYKMYNNLRGLFFNGLNYHNRKTKVFCWYGIPESLAPGEKAPAVILVHGGGGTAFPAWVKKWTDHGYIAISIALEGQVPGEKIAGDLGKSTWPSFEFSGPSRQGFFLDVLTEHISDQWFYHAVADVILANSLIRSFAEVDTSKIGITGISWGGIITNVVTGIDDRYDFSIPVYGCGYLDEAPTYSRLLKPLAPQGRQYYLTNWEPSLYVPLQKQPTLFINGTNDCHFPMNSFMKTYQASTTEKYLHVEYKMAHGHVPGWTPEVIYHFADYITKKGIKPPEFILKGLQSNGKMECGANRELEKAAIYYTKDTADWDCKNYQWNEITGQVSDLGKTISAFLPEGTEYFFINGTVTNGMMYSSPMFRKE